MFGIAVARLDQVSDEEKNRYQALYCGLCRALKQRYGQVSRATLSYDLAFYIMLCNSLYEPVELQGEERCIMHPKKKMPYAQSVWSDVAADVSVCLAYHKCLDDVADDDSLKAKAGAAALINAYNKARKRIPEICSATELSMKHIRSIELNKEAAPDAAANEFGKLLGDIFAYNQGIWSETMYKLGDQIGRFIYMMDAAVDLSEDKKSGSYNPFANLDMNPSEMRTLLSTLIGNAAETFNKLPLEQDVHLMHSIIYAGVWQKFNHVYEHAEGRSVAQ